MFRKRSPRLYHNELNRFKLELSLNIAGTDFFGILGDLSRDGLCAVVPVEPGDMLATEDGAEIHGVILGKDLVEKMQFDARIAWQEMEKFRGEHACLFGLEFLREVELPSDLGAALSNLPAG